MSVIFSEINWKWICYLSFHFCTTCKIRRLFLSLITVHNGGFPCLRIKLRKKCFLSQISSVFFFSLKVVPTLTTNSGYLQKYHFPGSGICLVQGNKCIWEIVINLGKTAISVGNSSNKTANLKSIESMSWSIFWNGREKMKFNVAKIWLNVWALGL